MYGVSRISSAENVMLVSYSSVEPSFMASALLALADAGVVVDMISQSAPLGKSMRFSFTASYMDFDKTLKALGGQNTPLVSGGYSKINLFGEEMVESVGVAARALDALQKEGVEIAMITTSDLDISLLVRQEDADVATTCLEKAYQL